MAHIDEPVVHRDTTIIEDGHTTGTGYGAGMMLGALAIVAAVIIGLALLFTQPWDDNNGGNTTPGTSDSGGAPDAPDAPVVPDAPDAPGVPDAPSAPDGGDAPAP